MISAREGYARVGCPDCGNVRALPLDEGEQPPWCVHHDGNYSWKDPHPTTQASDRAWTRMVRVAVVAADTLTPTYVVRAKPEGESIQDTWFHEEEPFGTPHARVAAHQYAAQTGRRLEVRWTSPWQDEPIDRSIA